MPTDRWQRLEQLFTEAVALPAGMRADFLARACGPDTAMRDEIASLLTAVERSAATFSPRPRSTSSRGRSRARGGVSSPATASPSYTVQRRLGAGGMGEVWQAHDERLGRDVAIKLLLPRPSSGADRMRAFLREARAAGTLNHTNVLTVYDVGEHGGAPYLVTECLEGQSLRARLAAGALPVDQALDIALQVARGLGAAHARGIVHRDLKPENIFLAQDGRVKILDFGLATLHERAAASPAQDLASEIARSLAAGTAGYMAPEQVRGEAVDGRADIFALGAVLHEMLAGHRPFTGDSTLGTLDAVLTQQPPDLSALNPDIPPPLSRIVRRCLAKAPGDRFATVDELVSGLDSVVRARHPPPPPTLRAVFRRPAVMVTAALVMVAVAAGGWRWNIVPSRARWARTIAAPEAQRLANQGALVEAFMLARQALDIQPDDPYLQSSSRKCPCGPTSPPTQRAPTWQSPSTEPLPRTGFPSARRRSPAFACRAVSSA